MIGVVWFEVNILPWNNTVTYVKGHSSVMYFVFTAKILITYFQRVSGYLQYNFYITIFQSAPGKQPFIYLFILFIMSYLPRSTPSVCNTVLPGVPALHT